MMNMFESLERYDIILLIGNYGAGKSDFAKQYFGNRKRIDRHVIRHGLKEMTEHGERWSVSDWDEDTEGLVKHMEHDIVCHFLERNQKLVIDNTSLTKKSRRTYVESAKRYSRSIACVYLERDVSSLIAENRKKDFPVPDHIIVQLYAQTEVPSEDEGFDKVLII
jgi:predicted kinase